MKKVAFIVTDFPTISETFIVNQIVSLIDEGVDVSIYCSGRINQNDKAHKIIEEYQLMSRVISKPFFYKNLLKRYLHAFTLILKNIKYLGLLLSSFNILKYKRSSVNLTQFYKHFSAIHFKENSYDLIHAHFGINGVYINDVLNLIKKDNKLIVTFHGYDAHDFSPNYYKALFERKHTCFTVNTNYTKNKVVNLGLKETKITVLPVGLDTSSFRKEAEKSNKKRINIIFVGRLVAFKAPLLAIKIIHKLISSHYNIHFRIVGEGPEFDICKNYILKNNLSHFISLEGKKTQEEIKLLFNNSDIFLYPGIVDDNGRCENQGLVIQEAQSMGIPVVTSNVGGLSDGLSDGKTGFVLNENDIDSFVQKIIYLIEHENERIQMGKDARNFVVSNYDNKVLVKRLLRVYEN